MRGYSIGLLVAALAVGLFLHTPLLLQAGQGADPHKGGAHGPVHGQHVGALDLNSATIEELRQIPGISEATAKKIVESRPYARTDELITKKILSKAAYDNIRGHIAVSKPGAK
jgi:hypothetical protein